jgi:hypothetical protein
LDILVRSEAQTSTFANPSDASLLVLVPPAIGKRHMEGREASFFAERSGASRVALLRVPRKNWEYLSKYTVFVFYPTSETRSGERPARVIVLSGKLCKLPFAALPPICLNRVLYFLSKHCGTFSIA